MRAASLFTIGWPGQDAARRGNLPVMASGRPARPELVVADNVAALVETAAARIRALARRRHRGARAVPRRAGGRLDAARALSPPGRPASTGRAPTSSSATSAPCRPTIRSRTTAWRARRCSTPRASREANVFRWHAEAADLDAAARDYEQALRARRRAPLARPGAARARPRRPHRVAVSRHVRAGGEDRLAVAVDVPALATRRLTLTYPALLGARARLLPGHRRATSGPRWPTSSAPAARCPPRASSTAAGPVVHLLRPRSAAQDITSPR